nr:immunoglobulin heavy chain junction region [Macaca mulatta]MOV35738.1 immunoglobulin heavy chain junction region [Macaca mulatta]
CARKDWGKGLDSW